MRLRIDEAALTREAAKITAEIQRMVPRRYSPGGPIGGGASVVLNARDEVVPTPRLGGDPRQPWPRRFYAGDGTLNRLIADPMGDIHEVVREVERLCRREAHAAQYYRDHPELLGHWHPWLEFVATGEAAYLGWEPSDCDNG